MCQSVSALQPLALNCVLHVGTVLSESSESFMGCRGQPPAAARGSMDAQCTINTVNFDELRCQCAFLPCSRNLLLETVGTLS